MTFPFRIPRLVCAVVALAAIGHGVVAQGWGWGGAGGYDPDSDRGPSQAYPPQVYGQPGYGSSSDRPSGYGAPGGYGPPGGYGGPPPGSRSQSYGNVNPRCRDLESQLANLGMQNSADQDQLPRIDADMRQADAQYRRAESDAERADCYEDMFLFGRSLKRNPRCIALDQQVQDAKARLAQLKTQRDSLARGNRPRARRDDIIADLARNRCGDNYAREYEAQRSRSNSIFSFFTNEDPEDQHGQPPPVPSYGGAPLSSTFTTVCVRLCDGFYFPINYATSESQFQDDEAKCHSQCAAPAELYYHHSDQDVDQMVSLNGRPYSQLPNAFRNRKAYIRGCSCNQTEYSQSEISKSEEALRQQSTSKRADASPGRRAAPDAAPPVAGNPPH